MNDAKRSTLAALPLLAWLPTRYGPLPIAGMQETARFLLAGAVVTVTCSPRQGLNRTLEACEWLAGARFRVVPHLAARLVHDRAHLEQLLGRLAALAIALRLGLGPSVRSLRRQSGWMARLLRSSSYTADALLEGLGPLLGDSHGASLACTSPPLTGSSLPAAG